MKGLSFKCDRCQFQTPPNTAGPSGGYHSPVDYMPNDWTLYVGNPGNGELAEEAGHLCPPCSMVFKSSFLDTRKAS